MEINEYNIKAAYETATESEKRLLSNLFPDLMLGRKKDVTERIKTFEDACAELGENHPLVTQYMLISGALNGKEQTYDIIAYLKLRIICTALNEGWEPQFTKDECRWKPWFILYTDEELSEYNEEWKNAHALKMFRQKHPSNYDGIASAGSSRTNSQSFTNIGSHLYLKSEDLATYCGTQFIDVWEDFSLL